MKLVKLLGLLIAVAAITSFFIFKPRYQAPLERLDLTENPRVALPPQTAPAIRNCAQEITRTCQEKVGLTFNQCFEAPEEQYQTVFINLSGDCRAYLDYKRHCSRYSEELCGDRRFNKNLRCMHDNRAKLSAICQDLLEKMLSFYGAQ